MAYIHPTTPRVPARPHTAHSTLPLEATNVCEETAKIYSLYIDAKSEVEKLQKLKNEMEKTNDKKAQENMYNAFDYTRNNNLSNLTEKYRKTCDVDRTTWDYIITQTKPDPINETFQKVVPCKKCTKGQMCWENNGCEAKKPYLESIQDNIDKFITVQQKLSESSINSKTA